METHGNQKEGKRKTSVMLKAEIKGRCEAARIEKTPMMRLKEDYPSVTAMSMTRFEPQGDHFEAKTIQKASRTTITDGRQITSAMLKKANISVDKDRGEAESIEKTSMTLSKEEYSSDINAAPKTSNMESGNQRTLEKATVSKFSDHRNQMTRLAQTEKEDEFWAWATNPPRNRRTLWQENHKKANLPQAAEERVQVYGKNGREDDENSSETDTTVIHVCERRKNSEDDEFKGHGGEGVEDSPRNLSISTAYGEWDETSEPEEDEESVMAQKAQRELMEEQAEFEEEWKKVHMKLKVLFEEGEPTADEVEFLNRFLDHPKLVEGLWTMRRRWRSTEAEPIRRRCLVCEEVIGNVKVRPHEPRDCWIPLQLRSIYILRTFQWRKCFNCGRVGNHPHTCYAPEACFLCTKNRRSFPPHMRSLGICFLAARISEKAEPVNMRTLEKEAEMSPMGRKLGEQAMNELWSAVRNQKIRIDESMREKEGKKDDGKMVRK